MYADEFETKGKQNYKITWNKRLTAAYLFPTLNGLIWRHHYVIFLNFTPDWQEAETGQYKTALSVFICLCWNFAGFEEGANEVNRLTTNGEKYNWLPQGTRTLY